MAIEKTYLLGKNITLGCGFDLQAKAPLDSRQVVPEYAGLQALIDGNAVFEGLIVYDEETKKTYQAQMVDGVLAFREFGINEEELKALIASETTAAMEFKGAATALPENPSKGDFYKVTAAIEIGDETAKIGDSIVYDGAQWVIIPSGDDIEDTWRPIAGVNNDATLTFASGDIIDVAVGSDGSVTISHDEIAAPVDVTEEGDERTRTYITAVETDGFGHITGYKTATENVEDTNTTYTFEGQSDEATSVYFQVTSSEEGADTEVIYLDAYSKNEANTELAKKVDKVEGYSLVADTEIARLADVDNYDDEEVRGLIDDNAQAIEDLEGYVGTFTHETAKTVVEYINAKTDGIATSGNLEALGQRVTAVEGDVTTIKGDYLKAADIADFETKENVQKVADELADVKTTAEAAATKTDLEAFKTYIGEFPEDEAEDLVEYIDNTTSAAAQAGTNAAQQVSGALEAHKTWATTVIGNHTDAIEALQDAVDGKAAAEHEHTKADITDFAHTHTVSEITDFDASVKAYGYATQGALEALEAYVGEIDEDVEATTIIEYIDERDNVVLAAAEAKIATVSNALEAHKTAYATIVGNYGDAIEALQGAVDVDKVSEAISAAVETAAADATSKANGAYNSAVSHADTKAAEAQTAAVNTAASALATAKSELEGKIDLKADKTALEAEVERATGVEEGLQNQINLIMNNPDTKDVIDSIAEFTQYVTDHGTIADGFRTDIDKNKDDIAAEVKRAGEAEAALAGRLDTLEAIDHDAYIAADTALKNELNGEIAKKADASVVEAMDAAYKAADADLSAAIEAAKVDAANQDAVVLAEAQGYADQAKADAIAHADQAKADAIADAEGKVTALAEGQVATNAANIADIMDLLTWGSF